jgi:cysteinyl-tRNA synthetase
MPDEMPLATESIPEIVALIEELVGVGFAYAVEGDVYYRVSRFTAYGRLSRQRPDRVEEQEPNPLKEDPRDFALWKANKEGEDTWWDSPWGRGRPGWHIECSAMAEKALGPEFWIHGGGLDLVFPHHENEIAQSQAVGRPFARIWMHNGMLELAAEKMSKSLGNDVSLRRVLDVWGRETTLVYLLSGHWHSPLDFTEEVMEAAAARAERFREVFRNASDAAPEGAWERFSSALEDDFNTPAALAVMHEWRDHDLLLRALGVFGLASLAEEEAEVPAEIVDLAERRDAARAARDFEEADRLRAELEAAGWEARDEPGGYRLVRLR